MQKKWPTVSTLFAQTYLSEYLGHYSSWTSKSIESDNITKLSDIAETDLQCFINWTTSLENLSMEVYHQLTQNSLLSFSS